LPGDFAPDNASVVQVYRVACLLGTGRQEKRKGEEYEKDSGHDGWIFEKMIQRPNGLRENKLFLHATLWDLSSSEDKP
jgi:hypothetical protein